jgi:hypothetical protein
MPVLGLAMPLHAIPRFRMRRHVAPTGQHRILVGLFGQQL